MTLSPLITELLREDGYCQGQRLGNGADILNLGGGRGLFETNEFDIGLPTHQQRYDVQPGSGLTGLQFLLIEQRLLSAPEDDVQAATSFAVPTSHQNTLGTSWATNTDGSIQPWKRVLVGVRGQLDALARWDAAWGQDF